MKKTLILFLIKLLTKLIQESWYLIMNNYTPFLKLKSNEIMAFKELEASLKVACVPFFDIPKDDQLSEDEFKNKLIKQTLHANL